MIITIDGPVASGKSSVAQNLAKILNIYYLNTGLLYRAVAYILVNQFKYNEQKLINPELKDLEEILDTNKFIYSYQNNNAKILFESENITSFLKNEKMDTYSSILSTNKNVREILLSFQRNFAKQNNLIVDGRDCGSVVFPNADFKFFLTATVEERAKRWQKDNEKYGKFFLLEDSIKIISERDKRDKERDISPLIIPQDAIIIDNSNLTKQETVQKILKLI